MIEYKYTTDLKTKYRTIIHFVVFFVIAAALLIMVDGSYFLAWFISIVIAAIALMVLSIPRRVVLTEEGIDICCISDYTYIPYSEVAAIRTVTNEEMKWVMPLFAASGFFGYYGSYIDLKSMDFVKIYASKWSNFIEITDIYEDKYYISCDKESEFVERVLSYASLKQEDNE